MKWNCDLQDHTHTPPPTPPQYSKVVVWICNKLGGPTFLLAVKTSEWVGLNRPLPWLNCKWENLPTHINGSSHTHMWSPPDAMGFHALVPNSPQEWRPLRFLPWVRLLDESLCYDNDPTTNHNNLEGSSHWKVTQCLASSHLMYVHALEIWTVLGALWSWLTDFEKGVMF